MTVAVIPIKGRLPLVPHTIKQALKVVDKVICILAHGPEEYDLPRVSEVVRVRRSAPLGERWNAGFEAAKHYDPDHVLYIGSSDWVSENWIEVMISHSENYEMVGVPGVNMLHLDYEVVIRDEDGNIETNNDLRRYIMKRRRSKAGHHTVEVEFKSMGLGRWDGYKDERKIEPIGLGRVLNRDFLKRIDYKPFKDKSRGGMDYEMFNLTQNYKIINTPDIKCLSVSTNLWSNKHSFSESTAIKNDGFLDKWFPDAYKLMEWTEVKLINYENGMRQMPIK